MIRYSYYNLVDNLQRKAAQGPNQFTTAQIL